MRRPADPNPVAGHSEPLRLREGPVQIQEHLSAVEQVFRLVQTLNRLKAILPFRLPQKFLFHPCPALHPEPQGHRHAVRRPVKPQIHGLFVRHQGGQNGQIQGVDPVGVLDLRGPPVVLRADPVHGKARLILPAKIRIAEEGHDPPGIIGELVLHLGHSRPDIQAALRIDLCFRQILRNAEGQFGGLVVLPGEGVFASRDLKMPPPQAVKILPYDPGDIYIVGYPLRRTFLIDDRLPVFITDIAP